MFKLKAENGSNNYCGKNLARIRLAQHPPLSQRGLAKKLQLMGYGIGQKAISRMETGDRVIADYELLLLAKALGVSPVQLLGISDT